MIHQISTGRLTLERLKEIIDSKATLVLSEEAKQAIIKCRKYLDAKMEDPERPLYGITTGFGSLYNVTIPADELSQLQHNLVMSHACGAGETVRPEIVKLMLFLKAQSLSYGHSGAQLITVQRLIDMFNEDILPVVYQQGSLGASGDLAPLAHLSLPLIGLGEVLYQGKVRPAAEVWAEKGWEPITLLSKEGLALLNGTQFMSAHAVWSLLKSMRLSKWADRIAAMSLDAYDRAVPAIDTSHPAAYGPDRNRQKVPVHPRGQRNHPSPQGARAGPLQLPLHPAGPWRREGQHQLRQVGHRERDQLSDGQSEHLPG